LPAGRRVAVSIDKRVQSEPVFERHVLATGVASLVSRPEVVEVVTATGRPWYKMVGGGGTVGAAQVTPGAELG
jgi:hypothetical protein